MQNKGIKLKENNHDKRVMPKECKAAIVTCGGLCPGLNSVIREAVMCLRRQYGVTDTYGVPAGYRGFLEPESVTYLGWGEIDSDMATVNISATLREAETHVISNEQCEASEGIVDGTDSTASYNGLITDNMLCTFSVDKDSCQKDSGGPLISRGDDTSTDIQVGVASWGISCASDVFPGVAAR